MQEKVLYGASPFWRIIMAIFASFRNFSIRPWAVTLGLALGGIWGEAQAEKLGLGIMVGKPTGLSAKYELSRINSVNMALGWSLNGNVIYGHADYVWHNHDLIPVPRGSLPLYYGMGAATYIHNELGVGGRAVFGIEYQFPDAPLDVFLELVPTAWLFPESNFDLLGGLGMRYFF
jgi:hypothetical protein